MGDIIDQANDAADLFLRSALSKRQRNVTHTDGIGLCLNCGADVEDTRKRWCDADCRDDWQKEQKARGRAL